MDRIEYLETALTITSAEADQIRVDDARRLTGPGMLWNRPGAVMDVFFEDVPAPQVVDLWKRHARKVLDALGWQDEGLTFRVFSGGVNLAISAPMDQLYSAIFAAQTAWHFCAAELLDTTPGDFDTMISDLKGVMTEEANPTLIALIQAAGAHGIDILCDDDEVSIGHGTGSQTWPIDALPAPDEVNWDALHDIPIAFITGTNGKTTTTRLLEAIVRASGKVAGLTSTEFVRVGDDILDRGDYSGPGGARMLLRDTRLEVACLEVARGGILRRGLPTRAATAATVTNVANDHLGQYGVNTVPELAQAKFAVHRTLSDAGILALNADDPFVLDEAKETTANIWWLSLDPQAPQIQQARENGNCCAFLEGEDILFFDGSSDEVVANVHDVPLTMGGAARYNISNALAALCLARAMGIPIDAIRKGLSDFKPDAKDNPGRCNEFSYKDARVFVDFAHNPHSIAAVCEALSGLPAKRRFIMLSHAGDRSDQDIRDVTATALNFNPDVIVTAELEGYLRGRELGEIPDLIEKAVADHGKDATQILRATSPSKAASMILERLEPGDLALLLVLSERDAVLELLNN
ncbi:Mur ligase family protein [Aliiroseovarius sp. KMU-50]|uniref:Mur ligase family protein n=1 Tax=Aliiroseovarius salicola TaxID=3009082 RepID=A0ABT4VZL8_9RHOB|nr:Mur ligase family protein [Aliiroseovarius sp. KMU-50]MDA5093695.1 Mur ligase family protein [Aliiroseovarius sp. KMU-50]